MRSKLTLKIKRFDKNLPVPEHKTPGAAAFDVYARETLTIAPGKIGYIALNVAMQIPKGHLGILAARSSTHKMGLLPINGIGIIDEDYCGDNDELAFAGFNFTEAEIVIEKGSRVAQVVIIKKEPIILEEVEHLANKDRGGFGTTGKK